MNHKLFCETCCAYFLCSRLETTKRRSSVECTTDWCSACRHYVLCSVVWVRCTQRAAFGPPCRHTISRLHRSIADNMAVFKMPLSHSRPILQQVNDFSKRVLDSRPPTVKLKSIQLHWRMCSPSNPQPQPITNLCSRQERYQESLHFQCTSSRRRSCTMSKRAGHPSERRVRPLWHGSRLGPNSTRGKRSVLRERNRSNPL